MNQISYHALVFLFICTLGVEREPIGSYNVDGRRRQSQQLEKDFQATNQMKNQTKCSQT